MVYADTPIEFAIWLSQTPIRGIVSINRHLEKSLLTKRQYEAAERAMWIQHTVELAQLWAPKLCLQDRTSLHFGSPKHVSPC